MRSTQRTVRTGRLARVLAALAVAIVGALSACGDDGGDSGNGGDSGGGNAAGDPIVIAYPGAQSGFMNFYDGPIARGMEMAIEDINADGGVDGQPLELSFGPDNQSDVNVARDAALEALSEDPDFLHTSCDYDVGGPQAQAANEQGVLAVGCAGGTNFGLQGIGPLTFNTWHGNPTEAAVIGEFTADEFPNAYFLTDTSLAYSEEVCQQAKGSFEGNGGTVVGEDTFQNSNESFSAQINRLRQTGSDADAIVVCSYLPGGANLIKQIRAAGIETPIVGSAGGMGGSTWYEQVPNLGEYYSAGEVGSIYGNDPDQQKNELIERYDEQFGETPPTGHVFIGYSTIEMLARAVEMAGSTDTEAVQQALESFSDEPLLVGDTSYSAECHIPLGRPLSVLEARRNRAQFVERIDPSEVDRSRC